MIIKLNYVDGFTKFVQTDDFELSPLSLMRNEILSAEVFSDAGKKLFKRKRRNLRKYIKNYKPSPLPDPPVPGEAAQ